MVRALLLLLVSCDNPDTLIQVGYHFSQRDSFLEYPEGHLLSSLTFREAFRFGKETCIRHGRRKKRIQPQPDYKATQTIGARNRLLDITAASQFISFQPHNVRTIWYLRALSTPTTSLVDCAEHTKSNLNLIKLLSQLSAHLLSFLHF